MKEKIEVLGFVIDKNGLHKALSKVNAMLNAPRPTNAKELASFLGLVNFYARFLQNRSANMKPLYDLLNVKEFKWNNVHERAFEWVKNELISPRILANFDPKEEVVLACDASDYGISAILSHRYKDGSERPIAYASKKIPKNELKRAIIDKEAMAIVFGFKRFYQFVFGREIILRTDNKPLQLILGPRKGIPTTADNRLQRWAYFLSGFKYRIEHVKSEANANCDALSRLPVNDNTDTCDTDFSSAYYFEEGSVAFDSKMLAKESKIDKTISKIIKFIKNEWPSHDKLSDEEKIYHKKRFELVVKKDCLFWGIRACIPETMRKTVLKELHASHLGVVKIKMFARSYVWWPAIDSMIENFVKERKICLIERKKPANTPLTTWPWPSHTWSRIHCDFAGPILGNIYLVVLDAYSKWPEIINFKSNTKAYKLIEEFKKLFIRYGLPLHCVTDGGPQFRSELFKTFLKANGVYHSFPPPYYPATNGAAENFVQMFKSKVGKIVKGGQTLEAVVNKFLFDYRSVPHCTTGMSPAYMMYKREPRTRFDLLKASIAQTVETRQRAQIVARRGSRKISINAGDEVIDNYEARNQKRVHGEVVKPTSPSTYIIKNDHGLIKEAC